MDLYRIQSIVVICLMVWLLGLLIGKRSSTDFLLCFVFFVLNAFRPDTGFPSNTESALTIISIASVCFLSKDVEWILQAIVLVLLANAVPTIIYGHGLFLSASADNTMMVLLFPYVAISAFKGWIKYTYLGLLIFSVFVNQGSTPYFVALAIFAPIALRETWHKKWLIFSVPAIAIAALATQREKLFDSTGRVEKWKMFMQWWVDNDTALTGTGTGSFPNLALQIQGGTNDIFMYMHNEYLQVIFEQGWFGFSLCFVTAISLLIKAWPRPWLFSTYMGLLVSMTTQFPFRYLLSALMITVLIRMTYDGGSDGQVQFRE